MNRNKFVTEQLTTNTVPAPELSQVNIHIESGGIKHVSERPTIL